MLPQFENLFNEAIQQLVSWGGVFMAEDTEYVYSDPPLDVLLIQEFSGKRYIAHKTPEMDAMCAVRVKAREHWLEWRPKLIGEHPVYLLNSPP